MMRNLLALLFLNLALSVMSSKASDYKLEVVADGLNHPWSIAFLPDGDYLVAMRVGEVRRITQSGEVSEPVLGAPSTYFAGQGGFFDIALDPAFATNQVIYLAYAGGTPEANGTTVMRATFAGDAFEGQQTVFSASPTKDTPQHYGGKLQFLSDGTLLVTTGDGFEYREAAQDTFSHLGKIIRIKSDGSVPEDNPFADGKDGDPKVYSYGHRNPQGLTYDPATGAIYMHEHGPKGGDELNRVKPGDNYGWPGVTYGENYSGAYVSPLKQYPGITDALHYWVPSIAPSGLIFYSGDMFPEWQGDLFVGALVNKEVRHMEMEGGVVANENTMFSEIGERIREVRQGPGGEIYILTDGDAGKLIRISR